MSLQVNNAVIMAAGLSSRFAPLSYEKPKGLIPVKGEVLIERQIKQLKEAGIEEIIVVTGYQAEKFTYLKEKYGIVLVHNDHYDKRNNHYSLYLVKDYLKNTYICSADNYFVNNPFKKEVEDSYYASVYVEGKTNEWCMNYNQSNYITSVSIGGGNSWIMLGHVFFSYQFSKKFVEILEQEIHSDCIKDKLWEQIYIEHIDELPMMIQKYQKEDIFEFDSLDELREFDQSYCDHANSSILNEICKQLNCKEESLNHFIPYKENNQIVGCLFSYLDKNYCYFYETKKLEEYQYESVIK